MSNESAWLELYDLPVFDDRTDPRYDDAWKWAQELERGGRLTKADIFAVQCLIDALCLKHPTSERAGGWQQEQALREIVSCKPRPENDDGDPGHRCMHCGFRWKDGEEERHAPHCAYVRALAALAQPTGEQP